MPQVDAADIVRAGARRQSPGNLRPVAPGTIVMKVTDVGFMPIPGPMAQTIAGLLTVQLPPGVSYGSSYTVVLRQISGRNYRVLGTTEFRIQVANAAQLLPKALHNLSILRHVAAAIPPANRWEPIFARYVGELEDRVRAFGGDPDTAVPSPTGHPGGRDPHGRPDGCICGKVRRLFYDCFGSFEGFDLATCDGTVRFESRERGVERVALRACRYDLTLMVCRDVGSRRPTRLVLGCTPCDSPPDCRPGTPHQRDEPPPRQSRLTERLPATSPPRRRPRRRPDRPRGPVDPGHGNGGHHDGGHDDGDHGGHGGAGDRGGHNNRSQS